MNRKLYSKNILEELFMNRKLYSNRGLVLGVISASVDTYYCDDIEPTIEPTFELTAILDQSSEPYNVFLGKTFIPTKIIVNYPATIVFWNDGTKTVVKKKIPSNGTLFGYPLTHSKDWIYYGYCCALAKKIFGTNSNLKRMILKNADIKICD